MIRSKTVIAALALALVASNAWWAYQAIDNGITRSYAEVSYSTTSELLKQTVAILNLDVSSNPKREHIIRAAQLGDPTNAPFEKEGYLWVGQLGLRFNEQGQLTKVQPGPEDLGQ